RSRRRCRSPPGVGRTGDVQRATRDRVRASARARREPVPGGARAVAARLAARPGDERWRPSRAGRPRQRGGERRRAARGARPRAGPAGEGGARAMTARVAIIQLPGVNCESETAVALERVGLVPEIFRWTRPSRELHEFQGYVIPGGFSYQDRVRAGALAA